MKRLRLVKVVVQPILVVDDGETLEEIETQPVVVSATELEGFADRLMDDVAAAQERLNAEAGDE